MPNLELSFSPGPTLSVRQFDVSESIHEPFTVTLVVRSQSDLDFEDLIGQKARFQASLPGRRAGNVLPATWSGYCTEIEELGNEPTGERLYMVRIQPQLWALSQNRNYRLFQQQSEIEIVCTILGEWGVEVQLRIDPARYPARKYRVQYGESDLDFVQRNLEEVGVSYLLLRVDDKETVILVDEPARGEVEPALAYHDQPPQNHDAEWATGARVARRVRPARYVLQDIDYRKPANQPIRIGALRGGASDLEKSLERFDFVPGAFLIRGDGGDTPTADDKGAARVDERFAGLLARNRLEAKQAERLRITFDTNVFRLHPGSVVPIRDHARLEACGPLLVLSTTLTGADIGVWRMRCDAIPASTPYRPPMRTPKPVARGIESATVVGPPGEEIHTDEFGRIRVQFHWDREGTRDDDSSCWIPVSQPWGGAGYGAINLPRIGQEVVVDFLGGDVDRPLVTGRVFTNLQKVPYKLPASKTQSGWKSHSTGGGGGYNEMMFEDAHGRELVKMQAERDMETLVKNDERETIGQDQHTAVGANRTLTVGVDRTTNIGQNDSNTVGQVYTVSIGKAGTTSITMHEDYIKLETTSGSRITMDGDKMKLEAFEITVNGANLVGITAPLVDVHGKPIKLNC
jgi:type VI secretion system secreted protein VgrG